MAHLAATPRKQPLSVQEIARELAASQAHLSKVLQRLAKEGLIVSKRGPKGGFFLARSPQKVTLLQVYEAIEGPLESESCLLEAWDCEQARCVLGGLTREVHRMVYSLLANTPLSHFLIPPHKVVSE